MIGRTRCVRWRATRSEPTRGASLTSLFADYLASGRASRQAAQLASALQAGGYLLEAAALSGNAGAIVEVPGSAWNGRRLWTGTQLPSDAQAGDVWLDTCQLTTALLVPREELWCGEDIPPQLSKGRTQFIGWIDERPVQRWQFAAFLTLARLTPREVQLDPRLQLLDPRRLLRGAEEASVTDLTADEARLCANWFGKGICHLTAWQAAKAFLPATVMHRLWGEPSREWAGTFDEGWHSVVSPKMIDVDPRDEADADELPPVEERALFGDWAHPDGVTFRTYALSQVGLLAEPGDDGAWYLPVRLASRAPR